MNSRGVVAAGHPLTAEAGAEVLREGGNAVDAAVAAVMASCVTESPLTGLGAGGYMLVHTGSETTVLDFFVAVPGADGLERSSELVPIPIHFTPESAQVFHVGAASCGVPGHAGRARAGAGAVRVGAAGRARGPGGRPRPRRVRDQPRRRPTSSRSSPRSSPTTRRARKVYAPEGNMLGAGDTFRFPDLGDALERLGAEGAEPFYRGEPARRISEWVVERGGTLGVADLAAYEPIAREPVSARLPRPPGAHQPAALLGRDPDRLRARAARPGRGRPGLVEFVEAMEAAQAERTRDFLAGLYEDGFAARFLSDDRLGSTTHITAIDAEGMCASVTCSNGTGSGLIVPGTGVHVNNMLGEEDLNPLGFHQHRPGRRMPSMMSPTVVLRDGELEAGLGSGGSNRIRSAILQTILRLVCDGLGVAEAVDAPRVHFEAGAIQAEPGVDEEDLRRLEQRGYEVVRWADRNVFFGGVHAVARDPATGELSGAGDQRRGGAVAVA